MTTQSANSSSGAVTESSGSTNSTINPPLCFNDLITCEKKVSQYPDESYKVIIETLTDKTSPLYCHIDQVRIFNKWERHPFDILAKILQNIPLLPKALPLVDIISAVDSTRYYAPEVMIKIWVNIGKITNNIIRGTCGNCSDDKLPSWAKNCYEIL